MIFIQTKNLNSNSNILQFNTIYSNLHKHPQMESLAPRDRTPSTTKSPMQGRDSTPRQRPLVEYTPDSDAFSNFLSVAMAEANHDNSQGLMNNVVVVLVQDCSCHQELFWTSRNWDRLCLVHGRPFPFCGPRNRAGVEWRTQQGGRLSQQNMLPTRETAGRHEEYSTILNSLPNSLKKKDGESKSCNSFERIGGISNITIITWIGTLGP